MLVYEICLSKLGYDLITLQKNITRCPFSLIQSSIGNQFLNDIYFHIFII